MILDDALPELIGDLSRFGPLADRVQGLVDAQVARYRPHSSDWIVLPWTDRFYLFSEDREGQRRGREVVVAFLGPGVVAVETVSDERPDHVLPSGWKLSGLVHASYLRRVATGVGAPAVMLSRLEEMVASVGGRAWQPLELKPSHADLLRDFRLALLAVDDESARGLFAQIRLTGHVSAANLRYLRIEYLAAFGRWAEMRSLPHIGALLQARRPRAISETLLRMVWWTELAGPGLASPEAAFQERAVLEQFGPLLRSAWVPASTEGRLLCFLTALADEDTERQAAILARSDQAAERKQLEALRPGPQVPSRGLVTEGSPGLPPPLDPLVAAFDSGRFTDVIAGFLAAPSAEHADLAVSSVLDSGAYDHAAGVLSLVRGFVTRGELPLGRRSKRDLEELERLVDQQCPDWVAWASRLEGEARWAAASQIARDEAGGWPPISSLEPHQVSGLCDSLLEASGGSNADQLRACLDLLCREATGVLSSGGANDFCEVVLALLSEQENFSQTVRFAYLDLLAALLGVGPSAGEYRDALGQALGVWRRISSPVAVTWAIGVLEAATDSPCPDNEARTRMAVDVIDDARRFSSRLGLRERVEVESLAAELGLPAESVEARGTERDIWSTLDGKVVGIYSLLPRTEAFIRSRLAQLCAVGDVRQNQDKVATPALRALAERADYLIVDTWHAAHQATGAIDAVRPRDRQIMPRQRGRTGLLRALEDRLNA